MASLQPGQMLGQYQITSQIGKGGMATVYKAYQVTMDRYVALKVVSGQVMDDPNFIKRFHQEARLIAKLEHPHILPVHDFGEADGTPYMVMRFLEAGTLTELIEAGQMQLPEIDRIFTQLTEALEYAHENGVIHRDIKPSNAMLDRRGTVFLTDFGIAKMVEGSPGLTATGAITGTPSYMSPEQAQGHAVDQRSDIYSLGVVLFEMLTGRVPFEAETPMAVLFKQILDPPPPLSTVRADLPYTLEIVLLKALSKKPEDRFSSMGSFRAAWKKALAEAAEVAKPAPVPTSVAGAHPHFGATAPATPVATASASPTVMPVDTVVGGATAKKNGNAKVPLLAGGACVVVLLFVAVAVVAGGWFLSRGTTPVKPTATRQSLILAEPPLDDLPTSVLTGKGTTSWAAANSVFSIAFRDDEVLAAGFGGITIWNRNDDSYKRITTADGLPNANTGLVYVDEDKSLWVGSDAGLAHLDGEKTTIYNIRNGLDSNAITTIERINGRLFLGTRYSNEDGDGLLEFEDGTWKHLSGFPSTNDPGEKNVSRNVQHIAMDADGNLWVATDNGLARLNAADNQWTVFKTAAGLADDNITIVDVNPQGKVFVGTSNGVVQQFNAETSAFENYVDLKDHGIYNVCCMQIGQDNSEWFAGGNIVRYDPATNEWISYNADNGSFPSYSVNSIAMDDQGIMYFGSSDGGLARYQDGKFNKLVVPNSPSYGEMGRIVAGPDGKLVFGQLYDNGADQFDQTTGQWSRLPADARAPRAFDAQGRLWSGSWDGLWIFDADKTTHITKEHGLPSEQIYAVTFGKDGLAYLATGGGIATFDGVKVQDVYSTKDGLISDDVYRVFIASDGSLWAGLSGGFSHRLTNGTWEHFTSDKLFGGYASYFTSFVEDQDGNLWVATLGDGVYQLSQGKWKRMLSTDPEVGLPSNTVNIAALAPDGAIWFGTEEGAVRYDGESWQPYGVNEGLIHNTVNGLYIEPGGAVWFATNGGVTRLEP